MAVWRLVRTTNSTANARAIGASAAYLRIYAMEMKAHRR
jgi:hypothetical protein